MINHGRVLIFQDKKGDWFGEFAHNPTVGFVRARRGLRRKLCNFSDINHLSQEELDKELNALYHQKEFEVRNSVSIKAHEDSKEKLNRTKSSIIQALNEWKDELSVLVSDKTVREYVRTLDLYIKSEGNHEVRHFRRENNLNFIKYLRSVKSRSGTLLSQNTQNKHVRQLQIFTNWCHETGLLKNEIILKRPAKINKDIDSFDLHEIEILKAFIISKLSEAESLHGKLEGKRNIKDNSRKLVNYRNLLRAVLLCQHTLMRLGAMWSLKLEKIDLAQKIIRIEDNAELNWKNKKNKWPLKPINEELLSILEADISNRSLNEKYFLDNGEGQPWFLDETSVSQFFTKVVSESGLPKIRKPFHWGLRGSMCTTMLINGANALAVQQLMDHESIQTTMGYLNSRKVKQLEATNALQEMIKNQTNSVKTSQIKKLLSNGVSLVSTKSK